MSQTTLGKISHPLCINKPLSLHSYTESDEQRDSAVSCSSSDDELQFSEDHLSSFPLPPPHFHTHPLDNCQYPTVLVNIREVLIKSQQKATPKPERRKESLDEVDAKGPLIRRLTSTQEQDCTFPLTNGHSESHMMNGGDRVNTGESHMTNGGDHMMNGDDTVLKMKESNSADLSQDSVPLNDSPKTLAKSTSNDAISSSTGEEERSPEVDPSSQGSPGSKVKPPLGRRQTYHTGMLGARPDSRSNSSSSLTASLSGPGVRRYPSNAGSAAPSRSMSISGNPLQSSLRMQLKRKSTSYSLSVKSRSRKASVLSPTHKPNLKLVKVVLAGNDILVSHAAKAYAHLRMEEPNLFSGLELRFYYVPLSRASTLYGIEMGGASFGSTPPKNPELPEPMMEHIDTSGNDVHIGRFLAHMDSWYERNLMIAVHHLLRLLPFVSYIAWQREVNASGCWYIRMAVKQICSVAPPPLKCS